MRAWIIWTTHTYMNTMTAGSMERSAGMGLIMGTGTRGMMATKGTTTTVTTGNTNSSSSSMPRMRRTGEGTTCGSARVLFYMATSIALAGFILLLDLSGASKVLAVLKD